jgi:hypothetical protein
VVLNIDEYVMLFGCLEKLLVMLEQLHGWLCDEHMNTAFDGVQSDWVVGGVRCEDSDYFGISRLL